MTHIVYILLFAFTKTETIFCSLRPVIYCSIDLLVSPNVIRGACCLVSISRMLTSLCSHLRTVCSPFILLERCCFESVKPFFWSGGLVSIRNLLPPSIATFVYELLCPMRSTIHIQSHSFDLHFVHLTDFACFIFERATACNATRYIKREKEMYSPHLDLTLRLGKESSK